MVELREDGTPTMCNAEEELMLLPSVLLFLKSK